ncbi:kinase-like protein, partial [Basidiobolus meristosporus CBS 931.73]
MPGTLKQLLLRGDIKSFFNFEPNVRSTDTSCSYLHAFIFGTETKADRHKPNKKFTVYKISVTNGPVQWFISKRYSEFHKLHRELQNLFPRIRLPSFPPKRLIGSNISPAFVYARRQRLDLYLKEISEDPVLCTSEPVCEFFQGTSIDQESLYNALTNDNSEESDHQSTTSSSCTKRRALSFKAAKQKLGFKSKRSSAKRRKLTSRSSAYVTCTDSKIQRNVSPGLDDFSLLKVIGKGSYGKVMLARHKDSGRLLAIKSISKKQIRQKPSDIQRIMAERNVLRQNINHPFLVGLQYAFQTPEKLCFCIDYINGGELFYHLQQTQRFSEDRARFYVAEIASALEYLHSMNVIYRDLKPENCLLDWKGHIRLVDFGLAKQILNDDGTTSTFCGTPEYLAPEVLKHLSYDKTVDWYCLGAVLYEMLSGLPPYYSPDNSDMYERILSERLRFPPNISSTTRSFISRLMDRNPKTRLGGGPSGSNNVKIHRYFEGIDWDCLLRQGYEPPWKPDVCGLLDLRYIDPAFSSEPIDEHCSLSNFPNASDDSLYNENEDDLFFGFSYVRESDQGSHEYLSTISHD